MERLVQIQKSLENTYGAKTGLNVADFVRSTPNLKSLGTLLVENPDNSADLNVALLLDRDILAAWQASTPECTRTVSVTCEEISHFVYLSFNHNRGRSVTALEMEIQGEVDRIVLAFHAGLEISALNKDTLLQEVLDKPYGLTAEHYEESRQASARFLRTLSGGQPEAWSAPEFYKLRQFFHSDLGEKIRLSYRR